LNKIRFSAGSGHNVVGPALFIDGKFTRWQIPGARNGKGFQQLTTEIAGEAAEAKKQNSSEYEPKIAFLRYRYHP
jgi:hypothetical protein